MTGNFEFPPIHNFPPFFTKQTHEQTWLKQCQMWTTLILDYAAQRRIFELELSNETLAWPLFANAAINRRLSSNTLSSILDEMVASGQAEWVNGTKGETKSKGEAKDGKKCLLYWRKLGEWCDLLYTHVGNTGQTGSIVTVYELFHSDETVAFYGLPETMWRRIVGALEKQGRARLFDSGEDTKSSTELGIKFF